MDEAVREALIEAGFRIGDYGDFLGLTDQERRVVELRVAIVKAIRTYRESQQLTQKQLAVKMKSSQSRVAKIEAGATGISLDMLLRALVAVGGGVNIEIVPPSNTATAKTAKSRVPAKPKPRGTQDEGKAHGSTRHAHRSAASTRMAAKSGNR
jgi:transcriptional regulator with XRE-family HTH domain